jgi:hypothetical protein
VHVCDALHVRPVPVSVRVALTVMDDTVVEHEIVTVAPTGAE